MTAKSSYNEWRLNGLKAHLGMRIQLLFIGRSKEARDPHP